MSVIDTLLPTGNFSNHKNFNREKFDRLRKLQNEQRNRIENTNFSELLITEMARLEEKQNGENISM